jgi:tetratricopeptide (TPR) repeat protein
LAKSIKAFEQALTLANVSGNVDEQAQVLNGLSYSLWLSDCYKEAYRRAAAVLKLTGVSNAERAMAQSNLGMVSWLVGRLSEAEASCLKAVEIAGESGDEAGLSTAQHRLGLVNFSQTRLVEAEAAFRQALSLRQELNWEWAQGHSLVNLCKVAVERGDFDQAAAHFDSAHRLFEKINSRGGLMVVYNNRGRMLLYRRQPTEALGWLTKALPLALKTGRNAYLVSEIYRLIAEVSLQQGKLDRAKAAAKDALKLVEAVGNQEYVAAAQSTLAQIYAAQGDSAAAETMFQKAMNLFKQVGNRAGRLRTQLSYAQFLTAQGQGEQAASLEEKARTEAVKLGVYVDVF